MPKILLIGFRGSGKSSVGKLLAEKLGWEFKDADEEIERNVGKTISEMVKEQGWDYFRNLERLYLRDLLRKEKVVCALGGGAVLHKEELEALKKESLIIWLKAPVEVIIERLQRDPKTETQRPPLTDLDWEKEIERIYTERELLYTTYAHFTIDTSKGSVEEVTNKIYYLLLNLKNGERGEGKMSSVILQAIKGAVSEVISNLYKRNNSELNKD